MAKDNKNKNSSEGKGLKPAKKIDEKHSKDPEYFWSMSMAPKIDESTHWFQMLPAAFFTAVIIIITRMHSYTRPMEQFYWANESNLADFFSYYKMIAICTCAVLVLVILLYRIFCQGLYIKKSFVYIPMLVYVAFVLLSYVFSEYKDFAWLGYNDRFEGTVVLISYMIMLFYIINSVNTEKNVKWIIYPLAGSSVILGLLGLSQALGKDILRTTFGQKLIVPNQMSDKGMLWDLIDQAAAAGKQWLNFTFQNKEIYQTVYNINYVSFYITLLIPLFAMLFIRSFMKGKDEAIWKKIIWGLLFTLAVYNLVGSVSSGGYLGLIAIFIVGVIVLNKRILAWWKPIILLLVMFALMCFANIDQLQKEVSAFKGFFKDKTEAVEMKGTASGFKETTAITPDTEIDYFDTVDDKIIISVNGNELTIIANYHDPGSIILKDSKDKNVEMELVPGDTGFLHRFKDGRFSSLKLRPATDDNKDSYFIIYVDESEWIFKLTEDGPIHINQLGKAVDLDPIPHIGFKNNPNFGSGRGYIWSTSLPMVKETLLIGHGADTFCLYYPHKDYVGKYNADWGINMVVDKPHMMYLGIAINTGLISLIALCALWAIYIIQSIMIYFKRDFETDFITFTGLGIFLGICGFLAAGLVNDSSVSVMPMFYGLLGTGIAINMILKRNVPKKNTAE